MKKLILLIFIPLVFTCSSDSSDDTSPCPNQPQLTTYEVSNINIEPAADFASATLSGQILNIQLGDNCETFSITNQGFVYSTSIQPTIEDNVVNANGESVSVTLDGLTVETTYYVRTFITNVLGTFYGNEVSFITPEINNPLFLAENGITVKAKDWAEVGMTGVINGVTYTVADREMLLNSIQTSTTLEEIDQLMFFCTTKVTDMSYLFHIFSLSTFCGLDLSAWDVSNVTNMEFMFATGCFQLFGNEYWDVSNVTNMIGMFTGNQSFNSDLSNWDVSNVTNMGSMFGGAISFNQDISSWDVSNVINMEQMFVGQVGLDSQYNQDLSSWDINSVTNCNNFCNGQNNWTLPKPNFTNCGDIGCD